MPAVQPVRIENKQNTRQGGKRGIFNEAILELTRNSLGPVQLNIPITDSERLSFIETELPIVRTIKRYESDEVWDISLSGKKVMIKTKDIE